MRALAEQLFEAGVAAADPAAAVRRALADAQGINQQSPVRIIAFGKAACAMAEAAVSFFGPRVIAAIALTSHENVRPVAGVRVLGGGHPWPDAAGEAATREIEKAASAAHPGDLLLVLVSGGGSALLCAPPIGISLADKIALNKALVRSGADIHEVNSVRCQVSRLKGGRLAALASRAHVLGLVLSDVGGDDLSIIASGPTVPANANAGDAIAILERYGLLETIPNSIVAFLQRNPARPAPMPGHLQNFPVGSNAMSLDAVILAAGPHCASIIRNRQWIEGDIGDVARRLMAQASAVAAGQPGPILIAGGGEPTVRVTGRGKGGRNQELALRFALLEQAKPLGRSFVFLSAGTDGIDGPTEAAGAIVDRLTLVRIAQNGLDVEAGLARSDSNVLLAASGDLLTTGATGTNVADLQLLLLGA